VLPWCPAPNCCTVPFGTTFGKIIDRAGLSRWPKLFQNLRASRQTELAESFPIHVVCSWMGNSPKGAREHYLQTTEDHFKKTTHLIRVHGPNCGMQSQSVRTCRKKPDNRSSTWVMLPKAQETHHKSASRAVETELKCLFEDGLLHERDEKTRCVSQVGRHRPIPALLILIEPRRLSPGPGHLRLAPRTTLSTSNLWLMRNG